MTSEFNCVIHENHSNIIVASQSAMWYSYKVMPHCFTQIRILSIYIIIILNDTDQSLGWITIILFYYLYTNSDIMCQYFY